MRFLRDIRPAERRETLAAFLILFGVMAAHALLETARDALFLASLPAERLAWTYLLIAGISTGLFALQQRFPDPPGRRGFALWLLGAAAVNLLVWHPVRGGGAFVLYALYVWTGVVATLLVVRFWLLLGDRFSVSQAKRLFPVVGSGAVAGAITGSALAGLTAGGLGPDALVPISAAMLVLTAAGPVALLPRADAEAARGPGDEAGLLRSVELLRRRPYLRRVGLIILVSASAFTLIDFVFKWSVAAHVSPDRMGPFFAATYFALNVLSMLVQVLLVSRLLRTVRVSRVLSLLPALLVGAAGAVAVGGGFVAALVLRSLDGVFRHSLHRTALEVLYVPLPGEIRNRVKGVIDVLGQRGGQALASAVILAVSAAAGAQVVLAVLVVLLCALWILVARTLQTHYLDLFRRTLSDLSIETRFEYPELDLASLERLMAGLNSADDREVLASMDLLVEQGRAKLIPALILYHPSPRVVVRALEVFSREGRDDFLPITDRLLAQGDPEVRAATLRALAWVSPDPELYRSLVDDESPIVKATALIGAVSYGALSRDEADETMLSMAGWGTVEQKTALARAIQYSPGQAYEGMLLVLAQTRDVAVRLAVVRAMREVKSPLFIQPLMEMLSVRQLRAEARDTLVSLGMEARDALEETLVNGHVNQKIRLQIPRALAQFEPQPAADILMRHLGAVDDGAVRYRMLRSLLLLRARSPEIHLPADVLDEEIERILRACFRLVAWSVALDRGARERPERDTPVGGLIAELLRHKREQTVERLFHVISLRHPGEDARRLYRGVRSGDRRAVSSSLELLENLLPSPSREAVLATVDDLEPVERLRAAGPGYAPPVPDYPGLLRQLLERPGVGIRALVVHHIGELGMRSFREDLERLPSDLAGLVTAEVNRALSRLEETGTHG